ncbi:MAG: hypothetical protein IPH81_08950 [Candidatus Microthrix sp.]|nr:hypothetical protein [Candidatus Microthrix sp.]
MSQPRWTGSPNVVPARSGAVAGDRGQRATRVDGVRGWALAAAAAAVVAGPDARRSGRATGTHIDNLSSEIASGGIERSLNEPGRSLLGVGRSDPVTRVNVRAAVTEDGTGYLFAEDLPERPDDQTYQLWAAATTMSSRSRCSAGDR